MLNNGFPGLETKCPWPNVLWNLGIYLKKWENLVLEITILKILDFSRFSLTVRTLWYLSLSEIGPLPLYYKYCGGWTCNETLSATCRSRKHKKKKTYFLITEHCRRHIYCEWAAFFGQNYNYLCRVTNTGCVCTVKYIYTYSLGSVACKIEPLGALTKCSRRSTMSSFDTFIMW